MTSGTTGAVSISSEDVEHPKSRSLTTAPRYFNAPDISILERTSHSEPRSDDKDDNRADKD